MEVLRIGGAGAGLGTMKLLAEAFEKSHPGTKIIVVPSLGSAGGIKSLVHGQLDIALTVRALKADEQKPGIVSMEYARTPFIFAVNKNVKKNDITTRELELIYKRQQLKWPDGSQIRLVLRPKNDASTMIIQNISKGLEQALDELSTHPEMIMGVTDQEAADAIEKVPGSLGEVSLSQISTENISVKLLTFNGVKPTIDNLVKGNYKIFKPLNLVTNQNASSAIVKEFIQFISSANGRSILSKSGNLPTISSKRNK
jgi:phosphate transport system substrate-binding protein